jgi:integrase
MTRTRNGRGEGNIKRRGDGRFEVRITLPEGGGTKSFYTKTKPEAEKKLREVLYELDQGMPIVRDERLTIKRYLDDWLERKRPSIRPSTWVRYRGLFEHITAAVGDRRLTSLSADRLERLYAQLLNPKPAGAGLSSTTVHHTHVALSQALADAERLGLVARNVAARRSGAKPPSIRQVEMHTLDLEQSRTLLATAADDRLEALYILAVTTGMREGELLALRWRDIDLEAAHLQVRGSLTRPEGEGYQIGLPKTKRSRRRIDISPAAIAALHRHRIHQAEEKLASGLGTAWGDPRWPDLIFTNEAGRCLDAPNLLKRHFHPLLIRAGLPIIRFHDLRHTAATLMLLKGVTPKVVSERLGHSSVAFTMDRYAHVLPSMQRDAANTLDVALFG